MYDINKDVVGKKFGRLTALSFIEKKNGHYRIECLCECGNLIVAIANNLKRGTTQSCGCLQIERTSKANMVHGQSRRLVKRTPEYFAWKGMKSRCYNKNDKRYADWGGRGIRVCDRWRQSFINFFTDMGKRPSSAHSLDRFPNTDGNYEPSNCRWATDDQQNRNKRNNHWIQCRNKKLVLQDWATLFGVNQSTLREHLEKRDFSQIVKFYEAKNNISYI